MISRKISEIPGPSKISIVVAILLIVPILSANYRHLCGSLSNNSELLPAFSTDDAQRIYSPDPKDSWNRIFNLLFTRTLKVRLSKEFPEGAPFTALSGPDIPFASPLYVSARVFDRFEDGDRAIEPLYPSFFSGGPQQLFKEPNYTNLANALTDALNESAMRSPVARALMQTDAWAAYDVLYRTYQGVDEFAARKDRLLKLLAQFIRKIALSPEEIKQVPQNCAAGGRKHQIPEFFEPASGWIEYELMPLRLHDEAVAFRREARLFAKPIATPSDKTRFLQSLRAFTVNHPHEQKVPDNLEAVALVIENLLIDAQGEVVASPLIQDVQIRKFIRDKNGALVKAQVQEYELSRRKLLSDPSNSGFIEFDDDAAAFESAAGNDYGFATPFPLGRGAPLLVKLSSRCADCHGTEHTFLQSLAVHEFLVGRIKPPPSVAVLETNQDPHANYVIARKMARDDFKRLRADMRVEPGL
jgi:hypothetical protein